MQSQVLLILNIRVPEIVAFNFQTGHLIFLTKMKQWIIKKTPAIRQFYNKSPFQIWSMNENMKKKNKKSKFPVNDIIILFIFFISIQTNWEFFVHRHIGNTTLYTG